MVNEKMLRKIAKIMNFNKERNFIFFYSYNIDIFIIFYINNKKFFLYINYLYHNNLLFNKNLNIHKF